MSSNKPSPFQVAIYKAVRFASKAKTPNSNILVKAVAGAGKTTTTLGALDYVGEDQTVCMLAFNKVIADETASRIADLNRERAEAGEERVLAVGRTINSEGHRCVQRAGLGGTLDGKKMWVLSREVVPFNQRALGTAVVALARAARTHGLVPAGMEVDLDKAGLPPAVGLVPDTIDMWMKLAKRYEIEVSSPRPVEIDFARTLVKKSILECKARMDFDDQIYLPLIFNLPMEKYVWVFIDEAQDLNDANLEFISRMGEHFMFVGDESQSLYAFRGADADAMERIRVKFDCKVFPLSITYRCPVSVVNAAKIYDNAIEARPDAPMGVVGSRGSARVADFAVGDMVVCRFNAPLVQLAFSLISRNIPIRMQGRDLVAGITETVKSIGATSIDSLMARIGPWTKTRIDRFLAADDEAKAINLLDKVQMIMAVVQESGRVETIDDIAFVMEDLFRDGAGEAVVLSTIHRAKGMENKTIWWLNPNTTPKVKTKAQHQQELNARYVATTRAKENLFYVHLDGKKGKRADRINATLTDVLSACAAATITGAVVSEDAEVAVVEVETPTGV